MKTKAYRKKKMKECIGPVSTLIHQQSLTGRQVYPVREFILPHENEDYDALYQSAYQIGKLTLCLYDPNHFQIFVTDLKKRMDSGQTFTTPLERVVEGVEYLDSLTDWSGFYQLTGDEKSRLILLVDAAYPEYFGAEFAFFQKELQRRLQKYFHQMKIWEASNI